MNNIEYSDFDKFLASVGVALLVIACGFPWLVLREPFDLLVRADDLNELTPAAQILIAKRQDFATALVGAVPWVSIGFGVVGVIGLTAGLLRWKRKQNVLDREQRLKVDKLEKEIKTLSPKDIQAKVVGEILADELVGVPIRKLPEPNLPSTQEEYLEVEQEVVNRLAASLGEEYVVLPNQRLRSIEIDIVAKSQSDFVPDVIVVVKRSTRPIDWRYLRDNILRLVAVVDAYQGSIERRAIPLLVVTGPQDIIGLDEASKWEDLLKKEESRLGIRIFVAFFTEGSAETVDFREFLRLGEA